MPISLDLFLVFFKLGATTFGGGYAMISQIKETVVDKKQWVTSDELLEICSIAESTPGPIAINLATYIGYKKAKVFGSVSATLGVVLPSFLIIFVISLFFNRFIENELVRTAFVGIQVGVAFLILKAAFTLFFDMKKHWFSLTLFLLVTILMIVFDVFSLSFSAIYFILFGAIAGLIYYSIVEGKKVEK